MLTGSDNRQDQIPTMNARTLDCSDIDRYLGKPMDSSPIREPCQKGTTMCTATAEIRLPKQPS